MARGERVRLGPARIPLATRASGLDLRLLEFDNIHTMLATTPAERPELTDSEFTDIVVSSCNLVGGVVIGVVVNGIEVLRDPLVVAGCEFRHLTVRGRIKGSLILDARIHPTRAQPQADLHNEWVRQSFDSDEWQIDVSGARGSLEIRGYPSRLIRRNLELHGVVTRDSIDSVDWKTLTPGTTFSVTIRKLIELGWEDATLIADPTAKYFQRQMEVLHRLRELGALVA